MYHRTVRAKRRNGQGARVDDGVLVLMHGRGRPVALLRGGREQMQWLVLAPSLVKGSPEALTKAEDAPIVAGPDGLNTLTKSILEPPKPEMLEAAMLEAEVLEPAMLKRWDQGRVTRRVCICGLKRRIKRKRPRAEEMTGWDEGTHVLRDRLLDMHL